MCSRPPSPFHSNCLANETHICTEARLSTGAVWLQDVTLRISSLTFQTRPLTIILLTVTFFFSLTYRTSEDLMHCERSRENWTLMNPQSFTATKEIRKKWSFQLQLKMSFIAWYYLNHSICFLTILFFHMRSTNNVTREWCSKVVLNESFNVFSNTLSKDQGRFDFSFIDTSSTSALKTQNPIHWSEEPAKLKDAVNLQLTIYISKLQNRGKLIRKGFFVAF